MLKSLFGKKKGADVQEVRLSSGLAQAITESLGPRSIPAMPQAAQQAFALSTNPNADAHDFVEVIEADESLSARVLRIANSVFFDRGNGCASIPDAVAVIGLTEMRGLLNANALTDIFPIRHKIREQLWANDIACGIIARTLAQRILPSLTDQAFLCGLMHDVGKLLLLQKHTAHYEKLTRSLNSGEVSHQEAELLEFPFDHTDVGLLIAEKWNFTPDLKAAIKNHHLAWKDIPHGSLTAIVKGSDILAHALGLGHQNELRPLKSFNEHLLPEAWSALGIQKGDQDALANQARAAFQRELQLYTGGN